MEIEIKTKTKSHYVKAISLYKICDPVVLNRFIRGKTIDFSNLKKAQVNNLDLFINNKQHEIKVNSYNIQCLCYVSICIGLEINTYLKHLKLTMKQIERISIYLYGIMNSNNKTVVSEMINIISQIEILDTDMIHNKKSRAIEEELTTFTVICRPDEDLESDTYSDISADTDVDTKKTEENRRNRREKKTIILTYPIKILSKLKNLDKFLVNNVIDLTSYGYSKKSVEAFFDFVQRKSIEGKELPLTLSLHFGIEIDNSYYRSNDIDINFEEKLLTRRKIDEKIKQEHIEKLKISREIYDNLFSSFTEKFCYGKIKPGICCLHDYLSSTLKLADYTTDEFIKTDDNNKTYCVCYTRIGATLPKGKIDQLNISTRFCCEHRTEKEKEVITKESFKEMANFLSKWHSFILD